jgi:hypothetical protein
MHFDPAARFPSTHMWGMEYCRWGTDDEERGREKY